MSDRIRHPGLRDRRMPAEQAAALIRPGMTVAMSGFTGAGYPKAVPQALAAQIEQAHAAGEAFRIKVLTGASTAPELDGVLARARGHRTAPALPVRSGAARAHQRRRAGLHRPAPEPRRAVHLVRLLRRGRCRRDRGQRHHRGRPRWCRRRRSATTRPGSTRPTRSSSRSTAGSRRRWRACTTSTTAPRCRRTASPFRCCTRTTASASPTCAATRTRSSPSSRPTRPTATRRSRRPMPTRSRSPRTCSTSTRTRSDAAG